jgi:hypothetical protein
MLAAAAAEPGSVHKPRAASDRSAKTVQPIAGRKSVAVSSSVLSSDTLAALPAPGVLHPDLVPEGTAFVSSCSWNEAAGETCESKCPPIVINLPFGTKNVSNRALTSPGVIRVLDRSTGTFVANYAFNGLPANGLYKPASVKRLLVRCHPPGQASVGPAPPPTHDIVVETSAPEVSKNNNSRPFHVGPQDELVLP